MEKLLFDNGILELEINGNGVLRFNASDPNVYKRFYALVDELPELEKKYASEVEGADDGDELTHAGAILEKMYEIDREVKASLAGAFGSDNDFDALMGGVNLMAFGRNGERVITNLMAALMPYMQSGLEQHRQTAAADAVAAAKANRGQRRGGK